MNAPKYNATKIVGLKKPDYFLMFNQKAAHLSDGVRMRQWSDVSAPVPPSKCHVVFVCLFVCVCCEQKC